MGAGSDSGWLRDGYLTFRSNTVLNPLAARASELQKRAKRPATEMKTYAVAAIWRLLSLAGKGITRCSDLFETCKRIRIRYLLLCGEHALCGCPLSRVHSR